MEIAIAMKQMRIIDPERLCMWLTAPGIHCHDDPHNQFHVDPQRHDYMQHQSMSKEAAPA